MNATLKEALFFLLSLALIGSSLALGWLALLSWDIHFVIAAREENPPPAIGFGDPHASNDALFGAVALSMVAIAVLFAGFYMMRKGINSEIAHSAVTLTGSLKFAFPNSAKEEGPAP